jgi:pSer/pThr/pTyr-binding forkhead associated (FHA) protein
MAAGTKVQLRLGDRVVAELPFEGAELRVGRMKDNELVINNLAVSRFHAVLRRVGDTFEIEDLGSENGTFVEGNAVRGKTPLLPGAAITIGIHELVLRGPEAPVRPPPAAQAVAWDAAQTQLLGGRAAPSGAEEEAVAVAMEPDRDDEGAAEAIEAGDEIRRLGESVMRAPKSLDLPDREGLFDVDEDELALPSALPPLAARMSVEPIAAELLDELAVPEPLAAAPVPHETGAGTALFDFGLADDLGLSEGSLMKAARGRPAEARPATSADLDTDTAPPAAPAQHAGLIVEHAGKVERVVGWSEATLIVGRAPDCGLVLAGSGVSRRHARLEREGETFRVSDLGSANGIRVNGRRVESATLTVGDVIGIDEFTVTFVLDREPVDGVVRAKQASGGDARRATAFVAPTTGAAIPERDLVLEEDSAAVEAEKELELSAMLAAPRKEDAAAAWRFEVAVAMEKLPASLKRALAALGEDELRLPAELRLVRKR